MSVEDVRMTTAEAISSISPELQAELKEALDDLVKGIRHPEKVKAACERMDALREENRNRFGEQNIAVELIRQTRDRP
jgi:hypothetical protein